MKYNKSKIEGVYEIFPHTFKDKRGSLSKIFHAGSFEELGINFTIGETLVTTNYEKGVFRGFHLQRPPFSQAKTPFAAKGSFIDIVLDLRPGSDTYGQHDVFTVDYRKANMIYVPEGVANAYCILEDDTIVVYNLTSEFNPEYEAGVRYDSIDFKFPFENMIISDKDLAWPALGEYTLTNSKGECSPQQK